MVLSGKLNAPLSDNENDLFFSFQPTKGIDLYLKSNGLAYYGTNSCDDEMEDHGFYFAPMEAFHEEKVEMTNWGFSWGP